jgi:hypothetical protein
MKICAPGEHLGESEGGAFHPCNEFLFHLGFKKNIWGKVKGMIDVGSQFQAKLRWLFRCISRLILNGCMSSFDKA